MPGSCAHFVAEALPSQPGQGSVQSCATYSASGWHREDAAMIDIGALIEAVKAVASGVITVAGTEVIREGVKTLFGSDGNTHPVLGPEGSVGYATVRGGRTVIPSEITVLQQDTCETVTGNVFLQFGTEELVDAGAIPVAVVLDEVTLEPLLFEINLDAGFEVCLTRGIYSFYVFLIDGEAQGLLNAEIYGVALPSTVDLSGLREFHVDPPEAFYEMLDDSPIEVGGFG